MYGDFAAVYDKFQEIDYRAFLDFYEEVFVRCGVQPELVLDLACGTGNITIGMAEEGYDMIGVDLSPQMLQHAMDKARAKGLDILFLQQDMTDFELYGTVDAVVCALDGVNYIENTKKLRRMFHWVENYLNPGGVMIFDVNTEYKFRCLLGDRSFVYEDDTAYCVWNNAYDEKTKTALFDLNIFMREANGRYTRHDEEQKEYAYTIETLTDAAVSAGLAAVGVYGGLDFSQPSAETERLFFVLRKPEKKHHTVK